MGPTLGCGTPAIIASGRLIIPYCYTGCTILDNGPLRFTVRLDYSRNADGIDLGEHRIISLDKGSHFNRITVWYDSLGNATAADKAEGAAAANGSKSVEKAAGASLAAGIVINGHGQLGEGKDYIVYADPTDRPDVSGSTIYVAALFPDDKATIGRTPDNRNAVGIITDYHGERNLLCRSGLEPLRCSRHDGLVPYRRDVHRQRKAQTRGQHRHRKNDG